MYVAADGLRAVMGLGSVLFGSHLQINHISLYGSFSFSLKTRAMVDTILKKQPTKKKPILPVSTQEQSDSGYEELSLINTDDLPALNMAL